MIRALRCAGRFWFLLEIAGTAVALVLLVLSFTLHPDPRGFGTHTQLGLPPCGYLQSTGRPCLTCGMTTAFAAMAHLRPLLALRANAAGALLFLLVLATPPWCLHALVTGRDPLRFLRHPVGRWLLPSLLLVTALLWAARS